MPRKLPVRMHLKSGRYYYLYQNKWTSLSKDYGEALRQYARLMTDPADGGMSELLDDWFDSKKEEVTKGTRDHYQSAIVKIKKAFVEFHPSQVSPPVVAQFIEHMKDTPAMANLTRTVLKLAFDRAVLFGLAQSNPVTSIPRQKTNGPRKRYVTDAEFAAIREQSPPLLRAILEVAYYTGQRIGDVLKIQMVDIRGNQLYVKQIKTKAELLIEITPELRKVIDEARPGNICGQFPLFGRRVSYPRVRDWFIKARDAAGVVGVNIHDIRAKAITEANKQHLDPQKLAGHTTAKMTETYIRDRELPVAMPPKLANS